MIPIKCRKFINSLTDSSRPDRPVTLPFFPSTTVDVSISPDPVVSIMSTILGCPVVVTYDYQNKL